MDPLLCVGTCVVLVLIIIIICLNCTCNNEETDGAQARRLANNSRVTDYQPRRLGLHGRVGEYQPRRSILRDRGNEQITHLVQYKIIPYFQDQSTRSQFAVIVLLSERETENQGLVEFNPHDLDGRPVVNNTQSYTPARGKFGNYIVARPHNGQDAEIVILRQFETLWEAYIHKNGEQPHSILLYSWLMPCTKCTEMIINTLARRGATVTVAYTSRNREPDSTQKCNQQRLRQEFLVYRIQYNTYR